MEANKQIYLQQKGVLKKQRQTFMDKRKTFLGMELISDMNFMGVTEEGRMIDLSPEGTIEVKTNLEDYLKTLGNIGIL
jgi:hypothetical protein